MSNDRLLKNTIIIMIGNIGTKLLMFIMVPLYTKWLSTSEYGLYDTLLSLSSFLVPIITLQLEQSVFRIGIEKKYSIDEAVKNTIVYTSVISCIVVVVINLYYKSELSILFSFYILGTVFQTVMYEYIRGQSKMVEYAVSNIGFTVILFVLNWMFVRKLGMGINGLFISYIISYLVLLTQLFVRNRTIIKFRTKRDLFKRQLKYSIPLIPNTICFWITNLSDRFMILYFLGADSNGIYAVATKVPTIITMVYSAFVLAWQEEAIHIVSDGKESELVFVFKRVMNLLFSIAWIIIITLRYVIVVFFDEVYLEATMIATILVLATVYLCISQFLSGIMMAIRDTKKIGTSTVVAAIINVVVNVFFLNKGLWVAALSTLIAYAVMLLIRLVSVSKLVKLNKEITYICVLSVVSAIIIVMSNTNCEVVHILMILVVAILVTYINWDLAKKIKKRICI